MVTLPFETLFALAAGALVLSLTVASGMSHRGERRIPARIRRKP
jgi:hypothetical protein